MIKGRPSKITLENRTVDRGPSQDNFWQTTNSKQGLNAEGQQARRDISMADNSLIYSFNLNSSNGDFFFLFFTGKTAFGTMFRVARRIINHWLNKWFVLSIGRLADSEITEEYPFTLVKNDFKKTRGI